MLCIYHTREIVTRFFPLEIPSLDAMFVINIGQVIWLCGRVIYFYYSMVPNSLARSEQSHFTPRYSHKRPSPIRSLILSSQVLQAYLTDTFSSLKNKNVTASQHQLFCELLLTKLSNRSEQVKGLTPTSLLVAVIRVYHIDTSSPYGNPLAS